MDYSEKWGVDVEEAVKLALMDLKVSRDEVEVTVLEEPSKGFFGIGSKLAKVRVEKKKPVIIEEEIPEKIEEPVKVESKPEPKERRNDKKKGKERREKKFKEEAELPVSNVNIEVVNKDELQDIEEHEALTFLKEITEKMGLALNFKVKAGEDVVYLEMEGKDSGTVIGKRGIN